MSDSTDDRKFDKRTIERKLEEGDVSEEEHQAYLDDLPDLAENATTVEAEFEEGVLEEDGDESGGDVELVEADEEEASEADDADGDDESSEQSEDGEEQRADEEEEDD